MTLADATSRFIDAFNDRRWSACLEFIAADVEWTFHDGREASIVRGRDAYLGVLLEQFDVSQVRHETSLQLVDDRQSISVVEQRAPDRAVVVVLEWRDGLIARARSYIALRPTAPS